MHPRTPPASRLSVQELDRRRRPPTKPQPAIEFDLPQVWETPEQWWSDDVDTNEEEQASDEGDVVGSASMILASNAGRDVVVPREPEDIALKTPIRNPMTSLPEADVVELRDILVELDSQDSDESASRIRPDGPHVETTALPGLSALETALRSGSPLSSPTEDSPFSYERPSTAVDASSSRPDGGFDTNGTHGLRPSLVGQVSDPISLRPSTATTDVASEHNQTHAAVIAPESSFNGLQTHCPASTRPSSIQPATETEWIGRTSDSSSD